MWLPEFLPRHFDLEQMSGGYPLADERFVGVTNAGVVGGDVDDDSVVEQ